MKQYGLPTSRRGQAVKIGALCALKIVAPVSEIYFFLKTNCSFVRCVNNHASLLILFICGYVIISDSLYGVILTLSTKFSCKFRPILTSLCLRINWMSSQWLVCARFVGGAALFILFFEGSLQSRFPRRTDEKLI